MLFRSSKKRMSSPSPERATGARMRSHNVSMLLHLAWSEGEISRIDLARQSGSTVSKIVGELLEMGLVRESHSARTAGGRPPIVLRFDDDRYQLIGVDLGATHVSVALTNLRGVVLAWRSVPHPVQADPHGTLRRVLELVHETLAEVGVGLEGVMGLGLGVPSPVDPEDPDRLSERILPAWDGVRPATFLEEELGIPVFMENDANVSALAEAWLGAGREVGTLAFIKLGTGVGAGLFVDGEVIRGANGFAGEIGHTAIDSSGPRCTCGLRGCLQAMVGSAAILDRVRVLLGEMPGSTLEPSQLSLVEVGRAARRGDPAASEAVRETARSLGIAIANLFNLVNPSLVVLGGGLTVAGETLLDPLRHAIRERALWAAIARAEVVIGELGERTAALGATILVLRAALADPSMFIDPPARVAGHPPASRLARAQETP
jgi:predicted NBD/HSP70 family sugar kinase